MLMPSARASLAKPSMLSPAKPPTLAISRNAPETLCTSSSANLPYIWANSTPASPYFFITSPAIPARPPTMVPIILPLGPRNVLRPLMASPTPAMASPTLLAPYLAAEPNASTAGFSDRKSSLFSLAACAAPAMSLAKLLSVLASDTRASVSESMAFSDSLTDCFRPLAALPSFKIVPALSVELVLSSSRACLSSSVEFSKSAIIYVDK